MILQMAGTQCFTGDSAAHLAQHLQLRVHYTFDNVTPCLHKYALGMSNSQSLQRYLDRTLFTHQQTFKQCLVVQQPMRPIAMNCTMPQWHQPFPLKQKADHVSCLQSSFKCPVSVSSLLLPHGPIANTVFEPAAICVRPASVTR